MKRHVLSVLVALLAFNVAYAQIELKTLIKSVNWHGTEQAFASRVSLYVEEAKKEVWEDEGTESNYRFKNLTVCGTPVTKSYVRVKQRSKRLFRLNLIVLDDETNIAVYENLRSSLAKSLGTPQKRDGRDDTWLFDSCKVMATFLDISNASTAEVEKYAYAIRIEPIHTFHVDHTKAVVEHNAAGVSIPRMEYFRIDNDGNVCMKEVGKSEVVKEKEKIINTPKGDVVVFNGGMFCYRPADNDIAYIKSELAVIYPIVKK